jgi:hypothetical protein
VIIVLYWSYGMNLSKSRPDGATDSISIKDLYSRLFKSLFQWSKLLGRFLVF